MSNHSPKGVKATCTIVLIRSAVTRHGQNHKYHLSFTQRVQKNQRCPPDVGRASPAMEHWQLPSRIPAITFLSSLRSHTDDTYTVFYHVPKTVSRILGLQPNVFFIYILSVFPAYNVLSCVCQLCNKEYMMIMMMMTPSVTTILTGSLFSQKRFENV